MAVDFLPSGRTVLSSSGDIGSMTVPWLFQELAGEKKTATAVFELNKTVKKVYFSAGDVVFASSNRSEDRTEQFLLRRGRITKSQLDAVTDALRNPAKKLGVVLHQLGILSPKELVTEVRHQVKLLILDLFTWTEGRYRHHEGHDSRDIIPFRMDTGSLIVEAVGGMDWKVIRRKLPPLNTVLRPARDPSLAVPADLFGPDGNSVLSLLNNGVTIEQLCSRTGIGDFNTLKAVYFLLALRLAEAGEAGAAPASDQTPERITPERTPVSASAPRRDEDPGQPLTRHAVEEAFEALRRQNDYQVLGVNAAAGADELKAVYFRLAKRYHPDRYREPEMSDLKEKLEALFVRVHEAYTNISEHHPQPVAAQFEEKRAEEYVENYAEKTGSALAYFQQGMKDFKIGNYWGAAEAFAWATRLDPVKAAYFHQYGLSLMHIPRRRHEAEEMLQKAIAIDPLRIEYHLELGSLYLKSGLKAKALEVYSAALQGNPDNESLKEALRAIGGDMPKEQKEPSGLLNKIFKDKKP